MKTILFQGDSITDCGRKREDPASLANGYPRLVAADIGFDNPNEYTFYNRGISGNRIVDLYARMKIDLINLKPDYMSILIGVNDTWHEINKQNGVDTAKYERVYSMLIEEVKEALPDIKIIILEPFVLKGSATVSTDEIPDRWERFDKDVREKAAAARRVADKFGLKFVPLQDKFSALDKEHEGIWTADGVHPTVFGHELITREWLAAFDEIK